MSFRLASKRLYTRCIFCNPNTAPRIPTFQHRTASSTRDDDGREGRPKEARSNPVLDAYRRSYPTEASEGPSGLRPKSGDIGVSSIFEDDRRIQEQHRRTTRMEEGETDIRSVTRDPENIQRVIDPNPNARERWERKQVIHIIRRGGRLSKADYLKRTEREHLARSHNFKTSVKKLGMLARQIAGKTIDDAITQMRFSRKKAAQDVLEQLEHVKAEAIVMRGMGLGKVHAEAEAEAGSPGKNSDMSSATTEPVQAVSSAEPVEIQLKDGKRHKVTDRSQIYIDQAWVGRGPYGKLPDYRARGRLFTMRTPWTSLSVLLKEEHTRIREWKEREEKRRRQLLGNVWTHLPDRPVQWQRQWYTF